MAKSVYSWGKAAKTNGNRRGSGVTVKRPSVPKSPKAGIKKTKRKIIGASFLGGGLF